VSTDYYRIPVIELWGRLIVSLQGDVSDTQMDQLRDDLLERVRQRAASGLVIDASGMWLVDSHLCAMLGRIVSAAALMGTRAVLAGLQPQVVITLGEMGIGLEGVATALSLEEALESLGVAGIHRESAATPNQNADTTIEDYLNGWRKENA
jgi:rsbT antagonist protein RsbS